MDKDKDLTPKNQDKYKDLTPHKDRDNEKDLTPKDQHKDKDLTPRTRTRTTARQVILIAHFNLSNVQW